MVAGADAIVEEGQDDVGIVDVLVAAEKFFLAEAGASVAGDVDFAVGLDATEFPSGGAVDGSGELLVGHVNGIDLHPHERSSLVAGIMAILLDDDAVFSDVFQAEIEKVLAEWAMICTAHNLTKLAKAV